jgi:hypothetical protein
MSWFFSSFDSSTLKAELAMAEKRMGLVRGGGGRVRGGVWGGAARRKVCCVHGRGAQEKNKMLEFVRREKRVILDLLQQAARNPRALSEVRGKFAELGRGAGGGRGGRAHGLVCRRT